MSSEPTTTATPAVFTTEPAAPTEPAMATASVEDSSATPVPSTAAQVPAEPAQWPTLAPEHPLLALSARLPGIIQRAGHDQIWGVTLVAPTVKTEAVTPELAEGDVASETDAAIPGTDPTVAPVSPADAPPFSTLLILQKFLRSVGGTDVTLAATNLEATLKWRKEFGLDKGVPDYSFQTYGDDFKGLGYVTEITRADGEREVVTWNIYGAVADVKKTFGDLDRFLHWRVALQETALLRLNLAATRVPIPDLPAVDPHRLAQVHDYDGVSFLRMDPAVKAGSKGTISLMAAHYPETLSRKFFVGVPLFMSWMFSAVRMFVSAETARKFVVVSYLENLAGELGDKKGMPARYGGAAGELPELEKALA